MGAMALDWDPNVPLEISADHWDEVRAAAAELDLVHGGYYRATDNGIRFFCGPQNCPLGWDLPFTDGSPELPREFVGDITVMGLTGSEGVRLRLTVANWAAVQAVKRAYDRGEYRGRFQEFVQDQEQALRGRLEDRHWLRVQFERLLRYATGALVD